VKEDAVDMCNVPTDDLDLYKLIHIKIGNDAGADDFASKATTLASAHNMGPL